MTEWLATAIMQYSLQRKMPDDAAAQPAAEEAPAAAPAPEAPQRSLRERYNDASTKVLGIRDKVKTWLFEERAVEEVPWYKLPVEILRRQFNGTIKNLLRRKYEAGGKTVDAMVESVQTGVQPIIHPLKTVARVDKYLTHPLRASTSSLLAGRNMTSHAVTAGADELYEGVIAQPVELIGHKIAKIPAIGEALASTANGVAKVMGWPLKGLRWIEETLFSPVEKIDDALGAYGAPAAA